MQQLDLNQRNKLPEGLLKLLTKIINMKGLHINHEEEGMRNLKPPLFI